jgi:hypothetical protein
MVKYRIAHGSSLIEFASSSEAEAYKAAHSLSADVEAFEEEDPVESEGPDLPPVTPRQLRLQLLALGIDQATVVAALNTLPSPTKEAALIEWEYSLDYERHNPLVESVGIMLGWDSSQLDDLWIQALAL